MSAPFPKGFPHGGGVYDQDPVLMHDFRLIRKFELDWKDAERQKDEARAKMGKIGSNQMPTGGGFNLEQLIDELAEGS